MFNDRDLTLLGAGAFVAILCIMLPISLIAKIILAIFVLVIFMVIALLRLGPDRVPLEVFLNRRIRFMREARRYTYNGGKTASATAANAATTVFQAAAPSTQTPIEPQPQAVTYQPMILDWEGVGIYWIVTAWLTVISVFFVDWLATGGSSQISFFMQHFRP
jgi:hypothetical protein